MRSNNACGATALKSISTYGAAAIIFFLYSFTLIMVSCNKKDLYFNNKTDNTSGSTAGIYRKSGFLRLLDDYQKSGNSAGIVRFVSDPLEETICSNSASTSGSASFENDRRVLLEKISKYKRLDILYRNPISPEVLPLLVKDPHFLKASLDYQTCNCLLSPPGTVFDWLVFVPPNSTLEVRFGLIKEIQNLEAVAAQAFFEKIEFIIDAYSGESLPETLLNSKYEKEELLNKIGWFHETINLSKFSNQNLKLRFQIKSYPSFNQNPKMPPMQLPLIFTAWGDPNISWGDASQEREANVVIISLDTLRADYLNCYGKDQPETSPFIDKLALQGAMFCQTVSQAPWTSSSHLSLMTSLYPVKHSGSFTLFSKMGYECKTLADLLQPDLITAAFTGGGGVSSYFGFSQGFSFYQEPPKFDLSNNHILTLKEASLWLKTNFKRRFFLFLHSYEPHFPAINPIFASQLSENATEVEKNLALYNGDIRSADRWVETFLRLLKEYQILDQTIIVFISDHGELLADHTPPDQLGGHGDTLYDSVLLVPLIIRYPPKIPKGLLCKTQIRLIDVAPTILELLDYKIPADFQGKSLVDLMSGSTSGIYGGLESDRPAFSQANIGGPISYSLRSGGTLHRTYGKSKYIYTPHPTLQNNEKSFELEDKNYIVEQYFDLENDPKELNNLAVAPQAISEKLPENFALAKLKIKNNLFLENCLNIAFVPNNKLNTRSGKILNIQTYHGILKISSSSSSTAGYRGGISGKFANFKEFTLPLLSEFSLAPEKDELKFNIKQDQFISEIQGFLVEIEPPEADIRIQIFENDLPLKPEHIFLGKKGKNPKSSIASGATASFVLNCSDPQVKTPPGYNPLNNESSPGCYIWWNEVKKPTEIEPKDKIIEKLKDLGYLK